MNKFAVVVSVAALALSACGQKPAADGDLKSAKARALVIPPGPTGPVLSTTGTVVAVDSRTVTLDHDGVDGLAAGRTSFRTWADVIAGAPGEPGARVTAKIQKLGDGWAVVELAGR
jgi:hypothetical protein